MFSRFSSSCILEYSSLLYLKYLTKCPLGGGKWTEASAKMFISYLFYSKRKRDIFLTYLLFIVVSDLCLVFTLVLYSFSKFNWSHKLCHSSQSDN